jgi:hypothetical protein
VRVKEPGNLLRRLDGKVQVLDWLSFSIWAVMLVRRVSPLPALRHTPLRAAPRCHHTEIHVLLPLLLSDIHPCHAAPHFIILWTPLVTLSSHHVS